MWQINEKLKRKIVRKTLMVMIIPILLAASLTSNAAVISNNVTASAIFVNAFGWKTAEANITIAYNYDNISNYFYSALTQFKTSTWKAPWAVFVTVYFDNPQPSVNNYPTVKLSTPSNITYRAYWHYSNAGLQNIDGFNFESVGTTNTPGILLYEFQVAVVQFINNGTSVKIVKTSGFYSFYAPADKSFSYTYPVT